MIKEFKEFIMRGNVVDLAIGVVIGGAFTAIVKSIVDGLITPLVALVIKAFTGSKDTNFTGLNVKINGIDFNFGSVVSAILTFLITGIVLFFIVKSINKLKALSSKEEEEATLARNELDYLEEIRDLLAQNIEKKD
ncbi:large conductance mechanosensitive channel [Pilibacter termitis]|uniref:Large-conductance mechanosensitive channel n=1 Tax=Pilibacter termitis TaxID=263852 RepID=A0A1T4M489_9ENTE|nr:large conductance mechanosensitive channel protein MscL [Pilibacter termitis]SJZ61773.1 large conductance mechanosensitive channel [Pilibacter termitis]